MANSEASIQQLQQELVTAQKKISELEKSLSPGHHQGITEYRMQDALLEDISNLRSLINSTEDLIWFVDRNKRVLLSNDATIATFKNARGIAVEPGMFSTDFLPEDQAEYYDQVFASAMRGKTLRFNHSAASGKEYAVTVQPVKKNDKIIGVSIFARDITPIYQLQEELRRFEQIIASTPDLIALLDNNYRYQIANTAYLTAFKTKLESLVGTHIRSLLGNDHFEKVSQPHLQKAFSGELTQFECWLDIPAQGLRYLSVTYHPLHSQDLKPKYIVINAHDITELKQAEDDRQRIFDMSLDMLAVIAFNGYFKELNPAWSKTLGWSLQELKDKSWLDLVVEQDHESSLAVSQRLAKGESVIGFENRCLCKDGSFRWLAWSSYPNIKQQRIFSAVRDITNRRRLEDELRQLATADPLTGASNRRHFIERATAELRRSKRYGSQMAVVMLDIDHFKRVNDTYGHGIGDEVLKRLVDCCHQELRTTDIFGRFGGEEFAAVLVETDLKAAMQTCQRLIQQISKLKIRTTREQISVTVSLGLTMHSADDISIDPLLKRADDALYKAKNAGRNQVVYI